MSVVVNAVSTLIANGEVAVYSQVPDAALVDGARRHDAEAFKELMTRYGPRIFRLAQRITRNDEDAEEVSQDSFARAFLNLDTFRGDSRFSTWLSRIAINQSLMKLRTRRRRELSFDCPSTAEGTPFCPEVADGRPTPEQCYSQKELQRILASAMGELPMTLREVLYLRDVEEHSTGETARMLGLSISAVKSRAHRGRQMLRQTIDRVFSTERPHQLPRKEFNLGRGL
jgi:RNA polymerase sigma-70 factor (ECF subfamily)